MLTYEEVPRKSFFCDSTEWFPEYKWAVSYTDSPIPAPGRCTSAVSREYEFFLNYYIPLYITFAILNCVQNNPLSMIQFRR